LELFSNPNRRNLAVNKFIELFENKEIQDALAADPVALEAVGHLIANSVEGMDALNALGTWSGLHFMVVDNTTSMDRRWGSSGYALTGQSNSLYEREGMDALALKWGEVPMLLVLLDRERWDSEKFQDFIGKVGLAKEEILAQI
jgi:hypothetical protein